jgi:propanol-preferring alcohol dehydrogenase
LADSRYVFGIPGGYDDAQAAPLLCAGLIGWRAYAMAGPAAHRIGLYGFGAAAHLIAQVAVNQGREVFAFTRPGDTAAQALARSLGAVWAGDSGQAPPRPLDARCCSPRRALCRWPSGGAAGRTVVCAGIP